jgi:hypothetical protein
MALGAFWNPAVYVVARAAEERRVFALVIAQLDDLAGMAGQAGVGDITAEFDVARCVGIRVAAEAAGQLEMRFTFMALAAERYNLPCCGGMPNVTVLAADLRLVFAACRSDVGRRFAVTFDTVTREQFRGLICRSSRSVGGVDQTLNSEKNESGQQNNPYSFRHAAFFHRCCLLVWLLINKILQIRMIKKRVNCCTDNGDSQQIEKSIINVSWNDFLIYKRRWVVAKPDFEYGGILFIILILVDKYFLVQSV